MRMKKVPKNTKRKDSKRSSDLRNRLEKKVAKMGGKELNHWPKDAQKLNAKLDQMVAERTTELRALNRELSFKAAELEQKLAEFRQTQKKLDHLASFPEINPNPVVEVNADGSIEYLNPAAKKSFPDLQDMGRRHEWLVDLEPIGILLKDQKKTYYVREVKVNGNWYHQSFHLTPGVDHIRIYGLDITERKRMEEELRKSHDELEMRVQQRTAELVKANELLEGMFSSINTMIAYMDKDFNFIRVNRAYAEADERNPEFYIGKNHFVLFPNEENEQIFRKVVETGEPYSVYAKPFEYAEHPERGVTHWDWSLQPVKEPGGSVGGVVLSLVNVTDRIRAEESVRRNEVLLRTVFETLPVGVWLADKEGRIVHGNPAGQQIWAGARYVGIDQFEEYKGWWVETGRQIEPEEWAVARAVRRGETSINEEIEIECFDGSHKIILNSAVPIRDEKQEIIGAFVVNQDIAERKRTEEKLREQAALLELAHDAIIVRNMEDRILFWNRSAEEMYGWRKGEALGAAIHDLLRTQYPKLLDEIKIDLIRMGHWEGELVHTLSDGKKIIVESRWALQRGEGRRPTLILQINRDITERKQIQKRIEATNALLNLFIRMPSLKDYLDAVLELVQNWSSCRCAGIRVLDRHGNIPYESYVGFSREFWESENFLSVKNNQCVCIRVITGEMDPQDAPVLTPAGSFCCGNTIGFIQQLSEEEKKRYRGVCVENGFLSVAVIPIRYGERVLGAVHLADEAENRVSFKALEFIESMAPLIGEAINRFNLEEELRESESRLRLLSSELLTVQEAERKRIAREIHDSIGQTLAAIKFGLESKLSQMSAGAPPPGVSVESIISLTQNGIEESRRIQMDLRPSLLDDLGILATIGWFTREFQKVYVHISVEKQISVEENEIADSLRTVLFRVMQEAMNNVAKHSKADLARLVLRKTADKIELSIEDNGEGFDPESMKQGLGLTSMRERTELSGGTFEVESILGKGTRIRASWPI
jgi:PAS domain S-box-containing protein